MIVQVRYIDPLNSDVLFDQIISEASKNWTPNEHYPAHREAAEGTLRIWSEGSGKLLNFKRISDARFYDGAFEYQYEAEITVYSHEDDGRVVLVQVFDIYPEKGKVTPTHPASAIYERGR